MSPSPLSRRRLVALLFGGALPAWQAHAAIAPADTRFGGLALPDGEGRLQTVLHDAARATWVDFWASWCTPCRQSFPWMNTLHDTLGPQGLRIVGINLDHRRADADRFLAAHPARFLNLFDPAADSARRFAIRGMPSSLLVSARGEVLLQHTGFRPSEAPALEARIRSALAPGAATPPR